MNFFDARRDQYAESIHRRCDDPAIDAIQEFNLMENPKAEYGWKPGAVVNVGIKSGTNTLHGAAYAFGRSDSFDARKLLQRRASCGACPGTSIVSYATNCRYS